MPRFSLLMLSIMSSMPSNFMHLLQIMSLQSLHMCSMQTFKMLLTMQSKMFISLQISVQSQMLLTQGFMQVTVTFPLLKYLTMKKESLKKQNNKCS
jgi:hypothetical protein